MKLDYFSIKKLTIDMLNMSDKQRTEFSICQ